MPLPPDLVARLDFKGALEVELASSNKLLPRRWDRHALRSNVDVIANNIRNRLSKGVEAEQANVVFVDKHRRGTRPITEMSLIDRTAYRALVELISRSLPANLVTRGTHQDFRHAPLDVDGAEYVSTTDVTSFYEFIDHDLLAQELEAQSGEGVAIDALMLLLFQIGGKRVGIPQIHTASDVLGDTYIDVVRRRLWRAGYAVFSYSDDFRIATASLSQAKDALELCAREVRDIGLALNESKTYTYGREKYASSLDAFAEAERKLFSEEDLGELVLIRRGGYEFDDEGDDGFDEEFDDELDDDDDVVFVDDSTATGDGFAGQEEFGGGPPNTLRGTGRPLGAPEDEDVAVADRDDDEATSPPSAAQEVAAGRALRAWQEQVQAVDHAPQLLATTESLLGDSLPILGAAGSDAPLGSASEILRHAPSLTPAVVNYFRKFSHHGRDARQAIRETLDELTAESSFSSWQKTWLAEAAGGLPPVHSTCAHYEWLHSCLKEENDALSAVAASALGRLGIAEIADLKRLLDRVDPAWRQLVLWGLAKQDAAAAAAAAEDKVDRLLVSAIVDAQSE